MSNEPAEALSAFFSSHPDVVVAYSGGIDSTYLLYVAGRYARSVRAVYVRTAFQPAFEQADAEEFCSAQGVALDVLSLDVFAHEAVISNPSNRCYHCKRVIFGAILEHARALGVDTVLDGTNADDDEGDRPGMRALRELGVLSPLRTCGLTKERIREAAREAGISFWDKPAYACLATRVPAGERITPEALRATEAAECFLMEMGFRDIRVRRVGEGAKIQILSKDFIYFMEKRREIIEALSPYYKTLTLDLKARDEK